MIDREKVLKGLECCIDPLKARCPECPYYPCYDEDTTSEKLLADALALLKEQEPRVLTLEEVLGGDECWFEYINGSCGYADVYLQDTRIAVIYRTNISPGEVPISDYGKKWRCWSYGPTAEQRKAVKWNDSD